MRDRERKRAGRWGLNCGDLPWPRGMSGSPVAVVDEVSGSALQAHQSAQSGDGAANGEPVDEAESPSAKAPGIGFSAKRLGHPDLSLLSICCSPAFFAACLRRSWLKAPH